MYRQAKKLFQITLALCYGLFYRLLMFAIFSLPNMGSSTNEVVPALKMLSTLTLRVDKCII
jgi:hypothetical protein